MVKIKILYFGDCTPGAMGIIHRDIKKIIDAKYSEIQFDLLDWGITDNYHKFFNQKLWKDYDLIIVDPYIAHVADGGWLFEKEDQAFFKSKLIPVYHHEVDVPADHFNHGWYDGWFTTPVCSINPYIVDQIKSRGVESRLLPIGVSREKFKPFKKVKKIKKVGFVGSSPKEDWLSIKRPDIFHDICDKAGIEPVIITGRAHGQAMYEDIDAIICPSIAEGLPTYFAEAVACKIPFISTEVGIVRYYDKVKKFSSVDEAIEIINYLNESEDNIEEYVNELHDQMFPDRDWENILEKYWIPYFKELTYKNLNMHPNKSREELIPQLLNKNNASVGVELGVFRGEFSKVLLENWDGNLYMIDPWRPLGDEYNDACDDVQLYDLYAATTKNIRGHESRGFMLRGLGEELLDLFEDESLDFIYIDANHAYDHVKQDLAMWYPKLKIGGLFSGHDYLSVDWSDNSNELYQLCENNKDRKVYSFNNKDKYFAGEFGVNPAVDEFCKMHNKDFLVTEEFWGTWYFIK